MQQKYSDMTIHWYVTYLKFITLNSNHNEMSMSYSFPLQIWTY